MVPASTSKRRFDALYQLFDSISFADFARNFGKQFFGVPTLLGIEAEVAPLVLQNEQGVSVVDFTVEGFLLFPLQPGFVKNDDASKCSEKVERFPQAVIDVSLEDFTPVDLKASPVRVTLRQRTEDRVINASAHLLDQEWEVEAGIVLPSGEVMTSGTSNAVKSNCGILLVHDSHSTASFNPERSVVIRSKQALASSGVTFDFERSSPSRS